MRYRASLVVLPGLRVKCTSREGVILPEKFIDGMRLYAERWDGPVAVFMESIDHSGENLDEAEIDPESLPFELIIGSYTGPDAGGILADRRLVLGCVSTRQNHLAHLCKKIEVPFVFVAENALKSRTQMVWATAPNFALALRRHWWELGQERRNRKAIAQAAGVQCNGTPTFESYQAISPNALLFFDTRTTEEMLIDRVHLEARLDDMKQGGPLRLLFSGRLIAIKGCDHLILVASELRRISVPFEMTICGGGDLEPSMKLAVNRAGLGEYVKFAGVLDFKTELTLLAKRWADVFVCCHRSGDPSCTYLETMSCGVPIVGYDNQAFRGLVQQSGAGWLAPMDRPKQLAGKIAELSRNRHAVAEASRSALAFARRCTFEETFEMRIEHMNECSARGVHAQRPAVL